ncbi:S1/P1 nuclease [Parerythrobacter jejuensis]|uniref:Endonuclease n=1 Tax=Parerythrobacter jejuensis TaxID=795812 RepID=A0A845AXN3_9SPHN|nr:S1/P1 nuclease [Parerythrobacter jejuensis]MXP30506.1 endonuclease [Parerythrobacter jejuensis]MXP33266.1 endonuclease [Parerythrobacter jejuensis]
MGHRTIRRRASRLIGFALGFLALLAPLPAQAWGFFAHTVTGDIALANIRPETRAAMERLFRAEALLGTPECDLATLQDATVWPDCVRRSRWRWGHTAAWHYRTTPICEPYNPRRNCPGGNCILAQIDRNQRILADESLPANVRLQALAFMVHFVGDVHMPLHHGDKDDRGGNDREADYGIAPGLNLHWIWDGPLAERAITSAQPSLVRHYSAAERAELAGGTSADWGRESWQISRDWVYPTAFDTEEVCERELPGATKLTQEDIRQSIPVSQRRVTQAGLRMARLLDEAFAPGPLPEPQRN